MGTGYTADTPLKVAHYGIDSVISLGDDHLLEKLRQLYCKQYQFDYEPISETTADSRAERITAYLNLIYKLVIQRFNQLKNLNQESSIQLKQYIQLLPDYSTIKQQFQRFSEKSQSLKEFKQWLSKNLKMGSIDVNIMTKLDKNNYLKNERLTTEYNDAHAALRGFANSDLESSIIFSAGMNPYLYSYLASFDDFYPNKDGQIKKKIIIKVSDYRSALVQGKYLAKKGFVGF